MCLVLGVEMNNNIVHTFIQLQVQHGRQVVNKSRHRLLSLQYTRRQPTAMSCPFIHRLDFPASSSQFCQGLPLSLHPLQLGVHLHGSQAILVIHGSVQPQTSPLLSTGLLLGAYLLSGVMDSSVDCGSLRGRNPLCFTLMHSARKRLVV